MNTLNKKAKLLILTQKVDISDDILGFMHSWIKEFARHCEQVTVICLQKGSYDLPENVKVLSLGKELRIKNYELRITKFLDRVIYAFRFYRYIWRYRKIYDSVFVHMNKEYVLLGGLPWRLLGKRISLWYAHYLINWQLKLAILLSHIVVTSTSFACKVKSKKLNIVGQGIDTKYFRNLNYQPKDNKINLLFLGRISPVKDLETLINAFAIVREKNDKIFLNIVGEPGESSSNYYQKINDLISNLEIGDYVKFWGKVSNRKTLEYYNKSDIFINLTRTGSFDKTTLEAMACERLAIVCNRSFEEIFPVDWHDLMIFKEKDSGDLAEKIIKLIHLSKGRKDEICRKSRQIIIENHSLTGLINRILSKF